MCPGPEIASETFTEQRGQRTKEQKEQRNKGTKRTTKGTENSISGRKYPSHCSFLLGLSIFVQLCLCPSKVYYPGKGCQS